MGKAKKVIIVIIMVALVGGYYFYLSNYGNKEAETVVTAVQRSEERRVGKECRL